MGGVPAVASCAGDAVTSSVASLAVEGAGVALEGISRDREATVAKSAENRDGVAAGRAASYHQVAGHTAVPRHAQVGV